jgi:hypothetical protein
LGSGWQQALWGLHVGAALDGRRERNIGRSGLERRDFVLWP